MQSQQIIWSYFKVSILVNDQSFRDNLYFGEYNFSVPSSVVGAYRAVANLPYWSFSTKFISFISGIRVYLMANTQQYEISLTEIS